MKYRLFCGFLIAIAFAGAGWAENKPGKKPDAEAIQGEWKLAYFEEEGEVTSPDNFKALRWHFADGKMTIMSEGKAIVESKYTLDSTKAPAHLTSKTGDEVAAGIYKLEGDTLTICTAALAANTKRPKEFQARKGSGMLLVKFKRVRKD
jgi:uncharacterized protein (TIGR03067 family)